LGLLPAPATGPFPHTLVAANGRPVPVIYPRERGSHGHADPHRSGRLRLRPADRAL